MKYYLPMLLLFLPNNFSLFFQNQCKYYDIYLLWHFSIMYFYLWRESKFNSIIRKCMDV